MIIQMIKKYPSFLIPIIPDLLLSVKMDIQSLFKLQGLASGRDRDVGRGEMWKQKWGSQGPCCFKHLNQAGVHFFLEQTDAGGWVEMGGQ